VAFRAAFEAGAGLTLAGAVTLATS
jgi:hypothetical protein